MNIFPFKNGLHAPILDSKNPAVNTLEFLETANKNRNG